MAYHLLILQYSCGHWQGLNIKHYSPIKTITQLVPVMCPVCRECN